MITTPTPVVTTKPGKIPNKTDKEDNKNPVCPTCWEYDEGQKICIPETGKVFLECDSDGMQMKMHKCVAPDGTWKI